MSNNNLTFSKKLQTKSFALQEKNQITQRETKPERKNLDENNFESKLDYFQNLIDNMEKALKNLTHDEKSEGILKVNSIVPSLTKRESEFQALSKKLQAEENKLKALEGVLAQERHNLDIKLKKIHKSEKFSTVNIESLQEQASTHGLTMRIINETISNLKTATDNWFDIMERKWSEERDRMAGKVDSRLQADSLLVEDFKSEFTRKIKNINKSDLNSYNDTENEEKFIHLGERIDIAHSEINKLTTPLITVESEAARSMRNALEIEIIENLTETVGEYTKEFSGSYQRDLCTLNQEIGYIKSEIEHIQYRKRDEKIKKKLKELKHSLSFNEQRLKVMNVQEILKIGEVQGFTKKNCKRLDAELNDMETTLVAIKKEIDMVKKRGGAMEDKEQYLIEIKGELEFYEEKFMGVRFQVEGVKEKLVIGLHELEQQLKEIYKIKDELWPEIKNGECSEQLLEEVSKSDSLLEKISSMREKLQSRLASLNSRTVDFHTSLISIITDLSSLMM